MNTGQPDHNQLVAANEDAAAFYRRQLLGPDAAGPRAYLTSRGFEALLTDTSWTIGYAPPSWTATRDHLGGLGYSDQVLLAAGLVTLSKRGSPVDRFRDRITFGIRDAEGDLVGYVARVGPKAEDHAPRYLNTPSTVLFDKSTTLFGLGEATMSRAPDVVLTEGPLDAIAVDLANRDGERAFSALAIGGTAVTVGHRVAIDRLQPSRIVLAFDADRAGSRTLSTAYRVLQSVSALHGLRSPQGTDPADLLANGGRDALHESLAEAPIAADLIVDHHIATWPQTQTGAEADLALLREILADVAHMRTDDVARQVARLTRRLPFDAATISRELGEMVSLRVARGLGNRDSLLPQQRRSNEAAGRGGRQSA